MTTEQKIYRVLRQHVSREDARYAAPKLAQMSGDEIKAIREA